MPPTFEFRLQPLLDWRKRTETEKKRELDARQRVLDECVAEIERLDWRRRRCGDVLGEFALMRSTIELQLFHAHLCSLEAALVRERERRSHLQAAYRQALDELVSATRERGVVEKLKERRLRAFRAEEARRDELELDEANARSHERKLRQRRLGLAFESAVP